MSRGTKQETTIRQRLPAQENMHDIRQCFPPVHDAYLTELNNKEKDQEFGDLCDLQVLHGQERDKFSQKRVSERRGYQTDHRKLPANKNTQELWKEQFLQR